MTIHASAIVYGRRGVLIRGKSGAGKSTLAGMLISSARREGKFAAFVSDDRVLLDVADSRLIASAPESIVGHAEIYGLGIIKVAHEPSVVLHCVIDIVKDDDVQRMPEESSLHCSIQGVVLPRQPVSFENTGAMLRLSEAVINGYQRKS
ncbi:MAG: HPr kinase/phosphatase C-terminal domain-containing protein [Stappiaceae bacterium]